MLRVQIKNNGILDRTLLLAPGSYVIGREQADIVLAHASVSKKHALLTVHPEGATISDCDSMNGVFCDGEKIREKNFGQNFDLEIAPFGIQGTFEKQQTPGKYQNLLEGFALVNMKLTLSLALVILIILTFAAVFFPLSSSVKSFQSEEILKRGRMYAKYLADTNKYLLESGSVTVDSITGEEGILYAFIVDDLGKILAPEEKMGTLLDVPEVVAALREGKEKSAQGNAGEKIFIYPIKGVRVAKGAAVVGFNAERAEKAGISAIKVYANLILLALLAAGIYLGVFLLRLFSMPLQKLDEDVNIAMKERKQHINFTSSEGAINNLVTTFNRLLFMNSGCKEEQPLAQGTIDLHDRHQPSVAPGMGSPRIIMSNLAQLEAPWCIINRDMFAIEQYSQEFVDILCCLKIKPGIHLLEAFDDPQTVKIISSMIDDDCKNEGIVIAPSGKAYIVRQSAVQDRPAVALFVLEDAAHE